MSETMAETLPDVDFWAAFAASPRPCLAVRPDPPRFTIIAANDALFRAAMTERSAILGRGVFEAFPQNPDDPTADGEANLRASLMRVLATREPDRMPIQRYDVRRPGGKFELRQWRPVNVPVFGPDGRLVAIVQHVEDATESLTTARALQAIEARMRVVFETSNQFQCFLAPNGILLAANRTALASIRAEIEDVIGRPFWDTPWFAGTQGLPEQIHAAVEQMAEGVPVRHEITLNLPTGRRIFDFGMRPVLDDGGAVLAIVPEAMEITEQRKAEEQLRQSQKMEAVGQLTGGLAHDFNNMLAAITGSLDLMRAHLRQGRVLDLERHIAAAMAATSRAAALTSRLLAFARRQKLDAKPTNINRLVAGMEDLIRRAAGPSVEVEVHKAPDIWTTSVDPNQLENALLNLCINACDAMPKGGRLTIESSNQRLTERLARERDLPPGRYVTLCVRDTGLGMAPDVVARAFDPFFTTKAPGKGTGLGLSMIYGFVNQSGGQVRIYSEVGRGTTVCMYLPRSEAAKAEAEPPDEPVELPAAHHAKTVLLVEDEPELRAVLVEMLETLGYATLAASEGADGIRLLQSDAQVELLITDFGLPGGVNGRHVAEAGRLVRPALKVLFITGYADGGALQPGMVPEGMPVLAKPFRLDALATEVAAQIGAA